MNWWRFVVAAEFRKILAFRADFWITFVGQTLVQLFIARALWQNVFEANNTEVMEGFTLPLMTLYYLIVPVSNRMLIGENMGFIAREIYDGTFSRYLIYPISFFNYKLLTYLTYSAFYGIQLFLIFILYHFYQVGGIGSQELMNLLIGFILIMVASLTYCTLTMCVELVALWAENVWALQVIVKTIGFFLGGGMVPIAFFPDSLEAALSYTPFPYMISLPARTIMGLATSQEALTGLGHLLFWSFVFRMLAGYIWDRGQHKYTGVGI